MLRNYLNTSFRTQGTVFQTLFLSERNVQGRNSFIQNHLLPNFTLSPRPVNLFFSHLLLYVRQSVTLPPPRPTVAVRGEGKGTIRRPPTMAEILGFVGATLKKSAPPSYNELSFRPSARPPSKPRVYYVRTTQEARAHRLDCHKGLTDICSVR
jgi:hypothetical protein